MRSITAKTLLSLIFLGVSIAPLAQESTDESRIMGLKIRSMEKGIDRVLAPWCAPDLNLSTELFIRASDNKNPAVFLSKSNGDAERIGVKSNDEVIKIAGIDVFGLTGSKLFTDVIQRSFMASATSGVPVTYIIKPIGRADVASLLEVPLRPSLNCKGFVFTTKILSFADRGLNGALTMNVDRLRVFSDEELLAFVVWNKAFHSVRFDLAPTLEKLSELDKQARVSEVLLFGKTNDPIGNAVYKNVDLIKVDLISQLTLKALGKPSELYINMLRKIDSWERDPDGKLMRLLRKQSFVPKDNLPDLTPERVIFLQSMANDIGIDKVALTAASLGIKRIVAAQAILDESLHSVEFGSSLKSVLAPYIDEATASALSARYTKSDTAKQLLLNTKTKQIIFAINGYTSDALGQKCGASLADCKLLAINDFAFLRKNKSEESTNSGDLFSVDEISQ
jgi:hypothetical protein